MSYKLLLLPFFVFCFSATKLPANITLGPNFYSIQVEDNGQKVEDRTMWGARVDYRFDICYGFLFKSTLSYDLAFDEKNENLLIADNKLGYMHPISSRLMVQPHVGVLTYLLRLSVDVPFMGITGLKEEFKSYCPYGGVEAFYKVSKEICVGVNYAFGITYTRTELHNEVISKNNAQTHLFSAVAEYCCPRGLAYSVHGLCNYSQSQEHFAISWYGAWLAVTFAY